MWKPDNDSLHLNQVGWRREAFQMCRIGALQERIYVHYDWLETSPGRTLPSATVSWDRIQLTTKPNKVKGSIKRIKYLKQSVI